MDTVIASASESPAVAILIRPDGYLAWAGLPGSTDHNGLKSTLANRFGAPMS